MDISISCGLSPSPTDSEPCGSKSTSSTLRPNSASDAPRLIAVVVLPTPPFWLHIETTRARPWLFTGPGSGRSGIGRPVGPSLGSVTGGRSKGRGSDTGSSSRGSGEGVVRTGGGISPASDVPPALIPRSSTTCRHGDLWSTSGEPRTALRQRQQWGGNPQADREICALAPAWVHRRGVACALTCGGRARQESVGRGARARRVDEVGVLRVLADPALDERAERQHLPG